MSDSEAAEVTFIADGNENGDNKGVKREREDEEEGNADVAVKRTALGDGFSHAVNFFFFFVLFCIILLFTFHSWYLSRYH